MERFFAWAVTGGTGVNGLRSNVLVAQELSLSKSDFACFSIHCFDILDGQ